MKAPENSNLRTYFVEFYAFKKGLEFCIHPPVWIKHEIAHCIVLWRAVVLYCCVVCKLVAGYCEEISYSCYLFYLFNPIWTRRGANWPIARLFPL